MPTITTRLAWYGNEEIQTNKIYDFLEKKINDKEKFDKDDYTGQNPAETAEADVLNVMKNKETMHLGEMGETKIKQVSEKRTKISGVTDIKLLSHVGHHSNLLQPNIIVAQHDTINLKDQHLFPKEDAFWKI